MICLDEEFSIVGDLKIGNRAPSYDRILLIARKVWGDDNARVDPNRGGIAAGVGRRIAYDVGRSPDSFCCQHGMEQDSVEALPSENE